jgi:hypothetical protein
MRESNSCGKVLYVDNVQGTEKVKDICMKKMHAGMMGRSISVFLNIPKLITTYFSLFAAVESESLSKGNL